MMQVRHFFRFSPTLKSKRLAIHGIGIQEQRSLGTTDRADGTGDYLFMYLYESGWLKTKNGLNREEPGTLVIWRPGDPQYFGCDDRAWRHTFIHCEGSWVRHCMASCHLPCNTRIRLPNATLLERHLFGIYQELTLLVEPDEPIVINLFENFLRDLRRELHAGKQAPTRELQTLRTYLDANFHAPLTLESLAQRMHLSVSRLCCLFKKQFSISVMAYVIEQRMQHASYLLRDQNLRIRDVAQQVGYDDPFHFSKLFKSRHGQGPREFRRALARAQNAILCQPANPKPRNREK
jgi:AraC-like DNA-binding protein